MPRSSRFFVRVLVLAVLGLAMFRATPSQAIDIIVYEELKDMAVEYGKISQRFVTCKMDPPYSVKVAFLKYSRYQGASDQHLEILTKIFDDGSGRVRDLRTGFSVEECKAKIESPEGQKLIEAIAKWGGK